MGIVYYADACNWECKIKNVDEALNTLLSCLYYLMFIFISNLRPQHETNTTLVSLLANDGHLW